MEECFSVDQWSLCLHFFHWWDAVIWLDLVVLDWLDQKFSSPCMIVWCWFVMKSISASLDIWSVSSWLSVLGPSRSENGKSIGKHLQLFLSPGISSSVPWGSSLKSEYFLKGGCEQQTGGWSVPKNWRISPGCGFAGLFDPEFSQCCFFFFFYKIHFYKKNTFFYWVILLRKTSAAALKFFLTTDFL